ncbi:unnamed protein product [Closterium sp. Yama58-4]|nr:unnamed protein product [Closterium sp. Yama58-4]
MRLGSDVNGDEWANIRRTRSGRITPELFTQFMLGLNAARLAEDRDIVVLVSSRRHRLPWGEGKVHTNGPFVVHHLTHTRIVQLHDTVPDVGNPVVQGIVAFFKAEFRLMWVDHQTRFMTRVPPAWVWRGNSPSAAKTLQWTLMGLQRKLDKLDIPDCVMEAMDYATWDDEMDEVTTGCVPEPVIRLVDDSSSDGRISWDNRTRRRFLCMASSAYTRLASAKGVAPRDVVTLKRPGNSDLVDRLVRTPEKKVRMQSYAPSSSMSPTASEEICFQSPSTSLCSVREDIEYGLL